MKYTINNGNKYTTQIRETKFEYTCKAPPGIVY